jgi:hypothetical protein
MFILLLSAVPFKLIGLTKLPIEYGDILHCKKYFTANKIFCKRFSNILIKAYKKLSLGER